MRALTLWPEWIWCIDHLGKRVENRTWKPPEKFIGHRIALHAGAHIGGRAGRAATASGLRAVGSMAVREGWSWMLGDELDYMTFAPGDPGMMQCKLQEQCNTHVPDCSRPWDMYVSKKDRELSSSCKPVVRKAIVGTARLAKVSEGDYVPWGVPGMVHWHFSDVLIFGNPIAASGKQKLWNVDENQALNIALEHQFLIEQFGDSIIGILERGR